MEPVQQFLFNNEAPNVMLGTLTHNGQLHGGMARTFYSHASLTHNVFMKAIPTSLLAAGYNQLWCEAINRQPEMKWRYLAILHADIVPEDFWLDKLIELADKYDADVMSAIVPIKDSQGVTSTAVSRAHHMHGNNFSCYTRLTQRQVNDPLMPETFDWLMLREAMPNLQGSIKLPEEFNLLVNTGCVVIRCDRQWSPNVHFTINDRLVMNNGGLSFEVEPEDWYFSRRVREEGGRVFATRAVKLKHVGTMEYISSGLWGYRIDPSTIPL